MPAGATPCAEDGEADFYHTLGLIAATEERQSRGCQLAWPLASPTESFHRIPPAHRRACETDGLRQTWWRMYSTRSLQRGRTSMPAGEHFAAGMTSMPAGATPCAEHGEADFYHTPGILECENQTCECVEEPRSTHSRARPPFRSFQGMAACGVGTEPV